MHTNLELVIAILAATLATVITLAYEFRTVWRVFYGKLPESLKTIKTVPKPMAVALLALSALLILSALIIFLIGIVSEQISSLHYKHYDDDSF